MIITGDKKDEQGPQPSRAGLPSQHSSTSSSNGETSGYGPYGARPYSVSTQEDYDERSGLLSPESTSHAAAGAPPSYHESAAQHAPAANAAQYGYGNDPATAGPSQPGPSGGLYYQSGALNAPSKPPQGDPTHEEHKRIFRQTSGRFFKALIIAWLILTLFSLIFGLLGDIIGTIIQDGKIRHRDRNGEGDDGSGKPGRSDDGEWKHLPSSPHGKWKDDWSLLAPLRPIEASPFNCDAWSDKVRLPEPYLKYYKHRATSTFELPMSSLLDHTFFVHVRGGMAVGGGDIEVIPEYSDKARDAIHIVVEAYFEETRDFYGTHICQAGTNGDAGIFIMNSYESYLSHSKYPKFRGIAYKIRVTIPLKAREIQNATRLEVETHNLGTYLKNDWCRGLFIRDLDVTGNNGRISADTFEAAQTRFVTSNAAVSMERARTSAKLDVNTSNGGITCKDCCAENPSDRPSEVRLVTSNSRVNVNHLCASKSILVTTSDAAIEGWFDAPRIQGVTSNGHVVGQFSGIRELEQSGRPSLILSTSNGAVDVDLDFGNGTSSGKFKKLASATASIVTTNGPLSANLRTLPFDTELHAHFASSNGKIHLTGNSHFQGDFLFTTTPYASVSVDEAVPAKGEPERIIDVDCGIPGRRSGSWPWDSHTSRITGSARRKGESKNNQGVVWGKIDAVTSDASIEVTI